MIKPKHVYAIGIAGVGVSAIARYFLRRGVIVSGSDPKSSPLVEDLKKLGADIATTPNADRLSDVDLIIYSDDVPPEQVERKAATEGGIPMLIFAAALGKIMADYPERYAVTGTNGKSTTSAILGLLLTDAKLDPTVFVGSRVKQFQGNFKDGQGEIFVAEADEYRDHFLNLSPTTAVVTNIELDHVDYFHDLPRLLESFIEFADKLPPHGKLIYNADDANCQKLWANRDGAVTFGFSKWADVKIIDWEPLHEREKFSLVVKGEKHGPYVISIPGKFNVMNAVAAMTAAAEAGVGWDQMKDTISNFHGIWRRFEVLNHGAKITIVNDYAHHPTGVSVTLTGAKEFYPGQRIIAVFQPHHRHRLKALFNDFAHAFSAADLTIITDTYVVPGRDGSGANAPTAGELAEAIKHMCKQVEYAPTLKNVQNRIMAETREGDIIVCMGAGDIWQLGLALSEYYKK